jgi:hypothetical protein
MKETVLVCDSENCGSDTFNLVRVFDEDTQKFTHRTVCALCGERVDDPNEIQSEFDIVLTYRTTQKGRNKEDACGKARKDMALYPMRAEITSCQER